MSTMNGGWGRYDAHYIFRSWVIRVLLCIYCLCWRFGQKNKNMKDEWKEWNKETTSNRFQLKEKHEQIKRVEILVTIEKCCGRFKSCSIPEVVRKAKGDGEQVRIPKLAMNRNYLTTPTLNVWHVSLTNLSGCDNLTTATISAEKMEGLGCKGRRYGKEGCHWLQQILGPMFEWCRDRQFSFNPLDIIIIII